MPFERVDVSLHLSDHLLSCGNVVIFQRGLAHDAKGSEHSLASSLDFCDLLQVLLILGVDCLLEDLDGLGEVVGKLFALLLQVLYS